ERVPGGDQRPPGPRVDLALRAGRGRTGPPAGEQDRRKISPRGAAAEHVQADTGPRHRRPQQRELPRVDGGHQRATTSSTGSFVTAVTAVGVRWLKNNPTRTVAPGAAATWTGPIPDQNRHC